MLTQAATLASIAAAAFAVVVNAVRKSVAKRRAVRLAPAAWALFWPSGNTLM